MNLLNDEWATLCYCADGLTENLGNPEAGCVSSAIVQVVPCTRESFRSLNRGDIPSFEGDNGALRGTIPSQKLLQLRHNWDGLPVGPVFAPACIFS